VPDGPDWLIISSAMVTGSLSSNARLLLRRMLGPRAKFREGQWQAIDAIVSRRSRVLVVQRTGWGKSLVYFLSTKLLREQGAGPTILVSPLLSLMRNQIEAASRIGVRAFTINSSNRAEWDAAEAALAQDACDIRPRFGVGWNTAIARDRLRPAL